MNDADAKSFTLFSLIGALLVISSFGISLFFEGQRDIHYAPAVIGTLVFACLAIIPSFWRGFKIPTAPAAIAMFALWLYVTISLSWSSVPFASLVTYLVFVTLPICFFAPLLAAEPERWLKSLCAVLFVALAVCAAWAVLQTLFFGDLYGTRAHHPLQNPNNLAGLLNLGLLPALGFFLVAKDKSWTLIVSFALALLFLAGLMATESRGGLLTAFISSLVLIFMLRKSPPVLWQRLLMFVVPAGVLFAAFCMFTDFPFLKRIIALFGSDSAALARISIWQNTVAMLQDHLWLGTGLGTFYLYYPRYREAGIDNSAGAWAHMDPLQYGAEMGIAAPLLFYALCICVALTTIKALKTAPAGSNTRTIIAVSSCALLALVMHTHITFHMYIMPILIVAGAWLAAWYTASYKALGSNGFKTITVEQWQKPFMAFVTVCIAALISVMAASSAMGQHHLLRAHNLIKEGMTEQFVAAIEDAETWAPRSFVDPEVQLAAFYIDLLGPNAAALFTTEEQQLLYGQTLDLLDIASAMNPAWAEVDYKRGQLYANINAEFDVNTIDKAITSLEKAIGKDPQHFKAREVLSQLYVKRGFVDKAYATIADGLKYPHTKEIDEKHRAYLKSLEGIVAIKKQYEAQQQESAPAGESE